MLALVQRAGHDMLADSPLWKPLSECFITRMSSWVGRTVPVITVKAKVLFLNPFFKRRTPTLAGWAARTSERQRMGFHLFIFD